MSCHCFFRHNETLDHTEFICRCLETTLFLQHLSVLIWNRVCHIVESTRRHLLFLNSANLGTPSFAGDPLRDCGSIKTNAVNLLKGGFFAITRSLNGCVCGSAGQEHTALLSWTEGSCLCGRTASLVLKHTHKVQLSEQSPQSGCVRLHEPTSHSKSS